jgi:hypothetical protein
MGLVIEPDENFQGVCVEIRTKSVKIYNREAPDDDVCGDDDYAEISKEYLKQLVGFFAENPQHLEGQSRSGGPDDSKPV